MQQTKRHIFIKLSALLLVLGLFAPEAEKFAHTFNHHKHEVCHGESETHLHTLDVDCSFYKFKLNNSYTLPEFNFEIPEIRDNHEIIVSQYFFLSDYQRLHFSLRGPPFYS
ncbi:hypothetical protein AB9K24_10765 [Meridianimaribacter flavus]